MTLAPTPRSRIRTAGPREAARWLRATPATTAVALWLVAAFALAGDLLRIAVVADTHSSPHPALAERLVAEIKKMGYASIINLRMPTEQGAQPEAEEAAARAANIRYVALPFNTASPDPAVVARIEFARNPATTAAVITTWTASEITARTIAFRQESAVCDALPAGLRYRLMLTVPQTGDDLDICLAVGNVHRIQ